MSIGDAIVTIVVIVALLLVTGASVELLRWALRRSDDRGDWTEEGNGRIRW